MVRLWLNRVLGPSREDHVEERGQTMAQQGVAKCVFVRIYAQNLSVSGPKLDQGLLKIINSSLNSCDYILLDTVFYLFTACMYDRVTLAAAAHDTCASPLYLFFFL